ncbi:MAG: AAA family ATPase [Woeseia sp.]
MPWSAPRRKMYQQHFGLAKNPFHSLAEGQAVFEGAEQARIIASLRTALIATDSIAVLTGPVGVGKTTIVNRALQEMGSERLVANLGRTQVGPDEIVDLLLGLFGVVREPTRRFECIKTFNRILNEHASSGARIFIVIEDAERLGAEILEELEALTAADGGASAGANIILMGPQKLDKLIATPELERLRQRVRLQQALDRFSVEEVEVYLRHRIRAAGGDFDVMFEPGSALMVRRCSGGIPRVINGLCETALTVAAQNKIARLSSRVIFKVAVDVFGMDPGEAPPLPSREPATGAKHRQPELKPPNAAPPAADKAKPAAERPAAGTSPAAQQASEHTVPVRILPEAPKAEARPAKSTAEPKAEPAKPVAKRPAAPPPDARQKNEHAKLPDPPGLGVPDKTATKAAAKPDKPIPELPPKFKFADEIVVDRDTKPKLPEAKPVKPDRPAPPVTKPAPEPVRPASAKTKPAKAPVKPAAPAVRSPAESLEEPNPPAARSDAKLQEPPAPVRLAEPAVEEPTASFAKIDHDMLDAALAGLAVDDAEVGPDQAAESPAATEDAAAPLPEVTLERNIEASAPEGPDTAQLNQIAAELKDAKTLEDVSDSLAETIFNNEELEAISLKIREDAAKATPDEDQAVLTTSAPASPQPGATQAPAKPRRAAARQPSVSPPPAAAVNTPRPPQQAATNLEKPTAQDSHAPPAKRGPQPEPIENQFNTSITATLKTLSAHSKPRSDDDDGDETSAGLLDRLKDTFKS